ncbi:MAG: cyclic nucleotide-binding domain-containing protein [Acidimicrobiia bacterium]|jgi:CRP-like cAMP-binding protein|nr:cyclic nucleotide-binding domain-containing protein [Acidimicrobiia bacterium]
MSASLSEHLKRSSLFAGFSDRQIADVLATAKQRRFAAGEQIIEQGDEGGRGFYLVVEGRTEVRAGDTVLAHFGSGDYFGEMALLLPDTPRTADVIALEDTTCLVITQWDLRALLSAHPETGLAMMGELARRLADTDRTLRE